MTPERVVALVVSLSPVLAILGTIVVAVITRPLRAKHDREVKASQEQPALGVTVDDDHADDAIAAIADARDLWKGRAEEYRERLATANATLREHHLPTA